MYLPDSLDTGIIAFHDTERLNAKTCFKKFIESNFQNQSPRLEARVRALLHKDIPSRIKEADVVEIKAVGFRSSQDDADAMALVGNRLTGEFVIKNNGLSMGSVVDFITRNKPQTDLIELLEEKSDKIKNQFGSEDGYGHRDTRRRWNRRAGRQHTAYAFPLISGGRNAS